MPRRRMAEIHNFDGIIGMHFAQVLLAPSYSSSFHLLEDAFRYDGFEFFYFRLDDFLRSSHASFSLQYRLLTIGMV